MLVLVKHEDRWNIRCDYFHVKSSILFIHKLYYMCTDWISRIDWQTKSPPPYNLDVSSRKLSGWILKASNNRETSGDSSTRRKSEDGLSTSRHFLAIGTNHVICMYRSREGSSNERRNISVFVPSSKPDLSSCNDRRPCLFTNWSCQWNGIRNRLGRRKKKYGIL